MNPCANLLLSILLCSTLAEASVGTDPEPNAPGAEHRETRPASAQQQLLQRIDRQLAAAAAENQNGLLTAKSFHVANAHFQTAIRQFETVRHALAEAIKANHDDADLQQRLTGCEQRAKSALVETLLNAGSEALVRGQVAVALGHVDHALAIDPPNAYARAMRGRIEMIANEPIVVGDALRSTSRAITHRH